MSPKLRMFQLARIASFMGDDKHLLLKWLWIHGYNEFYFKRRCNDNEFLFSSSVFEITNQITSSCMWQCKGAKIVKHMLFGLQENFTSWKKIKFQILGALPIHRLPTLNFCQKSPYFKPTLLTDVGYSTL